MTKMKISIAMAVIFVTILFFSGCDNDKRRTIVFIIDMSASTDAEGRAKAFQAISGWFVQKKVKRGDKIVVIPITGDAWTESQGLIQRFQISEKREAYDADLKQIEGDIKQGLEQMERVGAEKPFQKTDIFGALKLAGEEFRHEDKDRKKTIIVLSDMIQDNAAGNFKSAPFLGDKTAASDQAKKTAVQHSADFSECTVFIGLLRSSDLKAMSANRREGLEAFWNQYFRQGNALEVMTAVDGPGQIDSSLRLAD
jgi:hypothetical protein